MQFKKPAFGRPTIGVDLGGTWMRAAVIRDDHPQLKIVRRPTGRTRPALEIVEDLLALVGEAERAAGLSAAAAGIAVPTTLDADDTLEPCFNLPTLGRFPLRRVAAEKLDREVRLENDANCYALGEWLFGAGRGARLLAGITLGTGIGVGLVRDGKILSGAHGRAGEIWRSPVHLNPADEAAGCLEDIASGMGLQKAYQARTGGWTDGERIAALARRGDAAASEVFAVFGRVLGSAIRWIVDLVDPDRIVLGGSVAGSMDLFAEELFRAAGCDQRMIVRGTTGEGAALFGAAALTLEPEEKPA